MTSKQSDHVLSVQRTRVGAVPDPFRELGVEPSASEGQIKKAYRKLALRYAQLLKGRP